VPQVVQFTSPYHVELVPAPTEELSADSVRVRTTYSGISAGTELTAYRGTNPYITRHWDADKRLFTDGEPTFTYPVVGWGYSETGVITEVGADVKADADGAGLKVGDRVHGIWGHRSEAVLPAAALKGRTLPAQSDPLVGVFARVGSIALNAILAANVRLGEKVAIFGQGVIGLLATRLAVLAGAEVIAVDAVPERLEMARKMGAHHTVRADVEGGAGQAIRELTGGGADAAIELSGAAAALHEAIRSVVVEGTVAASGFYQGGANALRLGEEFHHNRVRLVSSQISGVPVELATRWDQPRLVREFMKLAVAGAVDTTALVTNVMPASDVAAAFSLLDSGDPNVLQVVLAFDQADDADGK